MYMLTRLFHYSVALGLSAILLFSCKGKDGDPGPQGEAGTPGVTGTRGQAGGPAVLLSKGGFVKGTITGFRADGVTPINESFNFEYQDEEYKLYNSAVWETEEAGVYVFNVERIDSLTGSTFLMSFRAPLDLSAHVVSNADFYYSKDLGNNRMLGVEGRMYHHWGPAEIVKLTNLAYNQTTGLLTGNIAWTAGSSTVSTNESGYGNYSASGQPFTLTGSFSVQTPLISSFRKGVKSN